MRRTKAELEKALATAEEVAATWRKERDLFEAEARRQQTLRRAAEDRNKRLVTQAGCWRTAAHDYAKKYLEERIGRQLAEHELRARDETPAAGATTGTINTTTAVTGWKQS